MRKEGQLWAVYLFYYVCNYVGEGSVSEIDMDIWLVLCMSFGFRKEMKQNIVIIFLGDCFIILKLTLNLVEN